MTAPSKFIYGKNPNPPDPTDIDTTRRYDVFCREDKALTVYRNARFVAIRRLLEQKTRAYPNPFRSSSNLSLRTRRLFLSAEVK